MVQREAKLVERLAQMRCSFIRSSRARHGGLTEGYEAIVTHPEATDAELADLKYHGQHTTLRTTLNEYVRPGTAPQNVWRADALKRESGIKARRKDKIGSSIHKYSKP